MKPAHVYGVYMTKPVQLSDEAYSRLKNAKRPKESFSDVVVRLTASGEKLPLDGLIGLLTPAETRRARKWLRDGKAEDLRDARRWS